MLLSATAFSLGLVQNVVVWQRFYPFPLKSGFLTPWTKAFETTAGKGENANSFLICQPFSILSKTNLPLEQ